MKVFKQLLWFIIPTVLIWGFWFIYNVIITNQIEASNSTPHFGNYSYYLELFEKDTTFSKVLFNTFIISLASALFIIVMMYVCKLIFKFNSVFMYSSAFVFTTLTALFAPVILSVEHKLNISVFNVVLSLQIGISCCFICWLIDVVKRKITKSKT